jgi:hypothetical protein
MVIVTPLNNQGVCWAFIADRGIGRCFFPTRCATGFSLGLTGELEGDKISPSRVNLKEKDASPFLTPRGFARGFCTGSASLIVVVAQK